MPFPTSARYWTVLQSRACTLSESHGVFPSSFAIRAFDLFVLKSKKPYQTVTSILQYSHSKIIGAVDQLIIHPIGSGL